MAHRGGWRGCGGGGAGSLYCAHLLLSLSEQKAEWVLPWHVAVLALRWAIRGDRGWPVLQLLKHLFVSRWTFFLMRLQVLYGADLDSGEVGSGFPRAPPLGNR